MNPAGKEEQVQWIDAFDKDGKPVSVHPDDWATAEGQLGYRRMNEPIRVQERGRPPHQMRRVDYMDHLLQGLTSGAGDEITSAVRATADTARGNNPWAKHGGDPWKSSWDQYMALQKNRMERSEQAHPGMAMALNTAGAVGQSIMAPWLSPIPTGKTVGGRMVKAAISGALQGGATGYAAGHGTPVERAWNAGKGAVTGAVTAGLMPLASETLKPIAQSGLNALPDWTRKLGRVIPGVQVPGEDMAVQKVLDRLMKDGLTLEQAQGVIQRWEASGKPFKWADIAGEETLAMADAAMIPSTSFRNPAKDYLVQRSINAKDRIRTNLNTAAQETAEHLNPDSFLDTSKGFFELSESLIGQRAAAATPLYERAFAEAAGNFAPGKEIVQFLMTPQFKAAYRDALKLSILERKPLPKIYDLKGRVKMDMLNLEVLDAIKQSIGDRIWKGSAQRTMGPKTSRVWKTTLHEYTELLKKNAPESYSEALRAYSDPSKLLDAGKAGRKFSEMEPAYLARTLQNMTGAEHEHFLMGAIDSIRARIRKGPVGADYVKKIFGSEEQQQQLEKLFSKPGAYRAFKEQMEQEARLRLTSDKVRGGSVTEPRRQAVQELTEEDNPIFANLISGNPVAAGKELYQRAAGRRGRNAEAITNMMFIKHPREVLEMVQGLQQKLEQKASAPNQAGSVWGTLGGLLSNR